MDKCKGCFYRKHYRINLFNKKNNRPKIYTVECGLGGYSGDHDCEHYKKGNLFNKISTDR